MSEKNTEISEESNNKDPESNSTDENRCGVIMPIADTDGVSTPVSVPHNF